MKNKETILKVKQPTDLMSFLLFSMGGMKRNSVKALLSHRSVYVNGHIETQYNLPLQQGDEVRIVTNEAKHTLMHPKLRIVYEDDDLIAVEKQPGLLTVAAHQGSNETTVFSILKNYVRRSNPRAGIYTVHRLDRETSGLLVFAKSPDLQSYMRTYWHDIVTKRTYVALAEGVIEQEQGTITTWLTEDPKSTMVYSSPVDNGGKKAVTHYRVVKHNDKYSLLELNLETGRTNQIRVHLASIGHPVVSDRKYGSGQQPPIDRLGLHARILEFINPVDEQILHFETPVPRDFLAVFHTSN